MPNITSNLNSYYPPSPSEKQKKRIGATIAGGLIGMNAYYLPVTKDSFVQRAFDITKNKTQNQIAVLGKIAKEIENKSLSTEEKMILQEMNLSEDVAQIAHKCIELDNSVSDTSMIKSLKDNFIRNYNSFKKEPSLMDKTSNEAFRAVKKTKFKWGLGIGAAIGLALGLIIGRN